MFNKNVIEPGDNNVGGYDLSQVGSLSAVSLSVCLSVGRSVGQSVVINQYQ